MVTQMNFIDQFFETNSNVLAERLQASGYSAKQANNFLAETASAILKAFKHKEIELIISALEMNEPEKLLSAVNLKVIANNTDMSAEQARAGFEVIAPVMAMTFKKQSVGVVAAAASIAWGSTGDFDNLATKE
jgi:hypothetical protein